MEIPSNFTQSNFTANLVVFVSYWNGTLNVPLKLIGSALVYLLGPPLTGTQTASVTTTTQTVTQTGIVSSSLFAVGAGVPSIVAVILLLLLAQGNGGPKGG
jgi:hypothetical protein